MAIWEQVPWFVSGVQAIASGDTSQAADEPTDWVAVLVGPAVVAAIITVFLGGLITFASARHKDRNAARLDLRLKALNELYAPIRTLLGENKVLAAALRAEFDVPEGADWHALDHLEEIKANETAHKIIQEVLTINERIGTILEAKSGLDLGDMQHAATWEVHRRMLARAFTEGAGDIKSDLAYFPRPFEEEIVKMHRGLLAEVKSSVGIKS